MYANQQQVSFAKGCLDHQLLYKLEGAMPARFMCGCRQWTNDINESN